MQIVDLSGWIEHITDDANANLDRRIAIYAAQILNELRLAMADSIIRASAEAYEATLWTQDVHFKGIQGLPYKQRKAKR